MVEGGRQEQGNTNCHLAEEQHGVSTPWALSTVQVEPSSPKHSPLIHLPTCSLGINYPVAESWGTHLLTAQKMSWDQPRRCHCIYQLSLLLNMLLVAKRVLKQALNLSWKTALTGAPWKEEEWSPNYEFGGSNQTHRCELPLQPTFGKIGIILAGIFLNWALVRMGK